MAKNNNLSQWSLTLLRVVLGIIFAYHGYLKLIVPGGFTGTVQFFTAIKIPLPLYSALVVSVVEFFGGLLLILGLLTKITSILLIIEMLVAFFKVHLKQGFLIAPPQAYGYEFILLILAVLIVILASGAGKISIGKLFKNKNLQ